jgi:hypothetical protein
MTVGSSSGRSGSTFRFPFAPGDVAGARRKIETITVLHAALPAMLVVRLAMLRLLKVRMLYLMFVRLP